MNNTPQFQSSGSPTGPAGKLFLSLFFLVFFAAGSFFVFLMGRDLVRNAQTWTWKQTDCEIVASTQDGGNGEETVPKTPGEPAGGVAGVV